MDCGAKSSSGCFPMWHELSSFIRFLAQSVVTTLQKELVMMQASGQSFLVFVGVLKIFFTFELQSKSCANAFQISSSFCDVGFGVYETASL